MQEQLTPVPLSQTVSAYFLTYVHRVPMKMEGLGTIHAHVYQYASRVDVENWTIVKAVNDCRKEPPVFHACIFAAARALRHSGQEKLVYEGDPDPSVSVRNIIQSVAKIYNVDPSDLANQFPRVRPWLLHRTLQRSLPRSFDEIENTLKLAGDTKIIH